MQKYRTKTIAAEISDRLLRAMSACALGIGWFIALWGVCLPALTAGLALGMLFWMCARQFSKQMTRRREEQMRRMIGGELALDRLLLEPPRKAAFQCALWLAPRYPLVMQKAVEWGITGMLEGKKTCIRLIAQHPSQAVTAQQIVECAREASDRQLEQTLLCLTAPALSDASAYAGSLDPPMHIIHREELIELAGYAHPATDEDLHRLSRQKRTRHSPKEWLAVILDASRARRYFWYGTGLSLFSLLTGNRYYPIPAAICLGLFAGCKLRDYFLSQHRNWTG